MSYAIKRGDVVKIRIMPSGYERQYEMQYASTGTRNVIIFAVRQGIGYALEDDKKAAREALYRYNGCYQLSQDGKVEQWAWNAFEPAIRKLAIKWYTTRYCDTYEDNDV